MYNKLFKKEYEVYTFTSSVDAICWLVDHEPDLLLLDGRIDQFSGPQIAKVARKFYDHLPILFVTGSPTPDMDIPQSLLLNKPASIDELTSCVKQLALKVIRG